MIFAVLLSSLKSLAGPHKLSTMGFSHKISSSAVKHATATLPALDLQLTGV